MPKEAFPDHLRYALYSSSVELVFTIGSGVVGFTLDESIGEFIYPLLCMQECDSERGMVPAFV
eukprot:4826703-Amphidinium_carterae.1